MHNPSSAVPALPEPLAALLAPLGRDLTRRVGRAAREQPPEATAAIARALCTAQEEAAPASDLAVLDQELARLLAARELFMAWVERMAQAQGSPSVTPAQFLRAWSESTGRVIQLLKARRELGGASQTDALLDAVYAELEAELLRGSEGASAQEPAS